jgi:alkylhydroperoxidase family enzyme
MLAHGSVLAKRFLEPDVVQALAEDHQTAGLEPGEVAIMDLADKVARDASSVTREDIERLRSAGLSDAEISDVVIAAAVRCFFSKVLDGLGADPDARFASLDPQLREALTVGRAIAAA